MTTQIPLKKLESKQKHMDVSSIVFKANPPAGSNNTKITLNPPYQRNSVWELEQKQGFIDSLLHGINSHHIIFNIDENGDCICMDGKQRITTLVEYCRNEFPVVIDDINYYYDKIPENKKDDNTQILQLIDKKNFDRFPMSIDEYENLTYEDQVNIFHRIQMGKHLTRGELISAQFTTDNVTTHFNNYCKDNETIFQKFMDIGRKEHYLFIMRVMYMISKNTSKQPSSKQSETYIKSIKTIASIKNELNKIDKLLQACF